MSQPVRVVIRLMETEREVTAERLRQVLDNEFPGRTVPLYSLMRRLENRGSVRRDGTRFQWTRTN